jgi:hypothetical protein
VRELPRDIDTIVGLADPIVRNLLITQRYHDLSIALRETFGTPDIGPDANWSTFATWASKTAGQSIRNEEVPSFVLELVSASADELMHVLGKIESIIHRQVATTGFHESFVLGPIADTIGNVSDAIARGNLKVFAELAPQFVRFVEAFRGQPAPDAAAIQAWIEPLDPRVSTPEVGQAWLRSAFVEYGQALRTNDPGDRARFILLGNCLVGLHEQTRLQPEIAEAMDAPIHEVVRSHLSDSITRAVGQTVGKAVFAVIEKPCSALIQLVESIWERIATRLLMNLALPGGASLPLGRNIPKDAAAMAYLPMQLQNVTTPAALVDLLKTYDRARGATNVGSASVDWRVLEDRMNFIVNLFRSRQQDLTLFGSPFTEEQTRVIETRARPPGKL